MPICENNSSITSTSVDVDNHAEIAKVKKSKEQAYFNSYDFDAIEELPIEDETLTEQDKCSSLRAPSKNILGFGSISTAYLKQLSSYFTAQNRMSIQQMTKARTSVPVDNELQKHLDIRQSSSRSSNSSIDSSKELYSTGKSENNVTAQKTINNFILPRAMLKTPCTSVCNSISATSTLVINAVPNTGSINNSKASKEINGSIAGSSSSTIGTIGKSSGTGISIVTGVISTGSIGNDSSNVGIHNTTACTGSSIKDLAVIGATVASTTCGATDNSSFIQNYEKSERERVISSSHYSTEKSGSSGYYSSNLCSASSVEEHIYSEPVIDIVNARTLPPLKTLTTTLNRQLHDETGRTGHCNVAPISNEKVSEELRTLETSIENLDRHLKNYPKYVGIQRSNSFVAIDCEVISNAAQGTEKQKREQLPTIMEGIDVATQGQTQQPNSWSDDMDDSLMDIDLDSFLLVNEMGKKSEKTANIKGIDNPTFNKAEIIDDEALENNYKCTKYVNSCPEDAYNVESVIEGVDTEVPDKSLAFYLKKYEDQMHFQSTKDMLIEIQEKLRSLMQATNRTDSERIIPSDLEKNIATLKAELETYLRIMNHNSEMEIKQLCAGLVNNEKLVTMTKAFERRKSFDKTSDADYDFNYEPIGYCHSAMTYSETDGNPGSVRCSDPNFKMKRKSLASAFPIDSVDAINIDTNRSIGDDIVLDVPQSLTITSASRKNGTGSTVSQLQRNLSFQRPTLERKRLRTDDNEDDKNSILDWHKNKPSIWEMYYGTNRINQTLVGKRGHLIKHPGSILSYPSSRPESDFTLDLPRAEQLRLKMEKEKKFRHRCRILTTFLSLVFFLLTVMIVSLVLTRGKRMFGSML